MEAQNRQKLIAVVGPTASGKTGLAVALAEALNGEVVSCDSMQIYRGISIASAAPTAGETRGVPHHLVEFVDPDRSFSVAQYVEAAGKCIKDIAARGKTPVLCGGTGQYYSALADNLQFGDQPESKAVRERLKAELESSGIEEMYARLSRLDPEAAKKISAGDARRIIRALEMTELTGTTLAERNRMSRAVPSPYDVCAIGLDFADRGILYDRIEKRIDSMIERGLVAEARAAYSRYGGASQAIGHKEFFEYFEGTKTLNEAVASLKTATRHYAKRQLTWFRRDDRINWLLVDRTDDLFGDALRIIKSKGVCGNAQILGPQYP